MDVRRLDAGWRGFGRGIICFSSDSDGIDSTIIIYNQNISAALPYFLKSTTCPSTIRHRFRIGWVLSLPIVHTFVRYQAAHAQWVASSFFHFVETRLERGPAGGDYWIRAFIT